MGDPVAAADDLVVSTPERVAFQYPVAGLGSRFLAQLIDLLLMFLLLAILGMGAIGLGVLLNDGTLALLIWDLVGFAIVFGYFILCEAFWSGQTLGKRALHLRAVGDQGEPISVSQAVIRNLVRIVDFLPLFYGMGMVVLFVNGKGKRLGDLAAGTLVVREHDSVRLIDLERQVGLAPAPAGSSPAPGPAPAPVPAPAARMSPTEEWLRRVDPSLRRLAGMYARRRYDLVPAARHQLALAAEPALRKALPATVTQAGALAALDQLANLELTVSMPAPPPSPSKPPAPPQASPPPPPPAPPPSAQNP